MTQPTPQDLPANPHLTTFTILLQADPRCYRGFGWLWWGVKAALKSRVTKEELPLLGDSNEPDMVKLALDTYGDDVLNAAIDHYQQRAAFGQVLAFDDHLPDGAAYRLNDPDAGFADY